MDRPTLFEFAGGEEAWLRFAAAHHKLCLEDPLLNHAFSHPGHPQHVERLALYWMEVFGGPPVFSESLGHHSMVLGLHAGTGAGDDFGERFSACFMQAAEDAGLPDDEEFRSSLRAYINWAVGEVMLYAPAGSTVPDGLGVPRWSWSGLQHEPGSPGPA